MSLNPLSPCPDPTHSPRLLTLLALTLLPRSLTLTDPAPSHPIANSQEHFADLFRRYGAPVIVLDLVKQWERRPRESIVGREFRNAVEELNFSMPLRMQIRSVRLVSPLFSPYPGGPCLAPRQALSLPYL